MLGATQNCDVDRSVLKEGAGCHSIHILGSCDTLLGVPESGGRNHSNKIEGKK